MDLHTAANKINADSDLGAEVRGSRINVKRFGRPAGYITEADLEQIGHTATGWGGTLNKGALQVWQALQK